MGRLMRHGERPDDRNGQESRGQTDRGWENLTEVDDKVPASGDRAGGQVRLRDRKYGWWHGDRYRGYETAVASALIGR